MSVNGISGDWLRIAAQGHKEQNFAGLSKTLKDLNLMIHDVVMFCKLCQVSVVMLHSRENLQECDHCSVDLLYMTQMIASVYLFLVHFVLLISPI